MKPGVILLMQAKHEFILNDGLEGLRIYTVISLVAEHDVEKKYSFYRSTGRNSKYTDTWFPFAEKEPMHIKKPNEIPGYRVIDNYPQSFLEFTKQAFDSHTLAFENGYDELLHRFGNFECLYVSYLLNGGYWVHDDSRILREYLSQNYSRELEILTTSIKNFDSFKNPSGTSVTGRELYWNYRHRFHDENLNYSRQLFHYPEIQRSLISGNSNNSLPVELGESINSDPINLNSSAGHDSFLPINLSMQILGGFIAVLGVAAIATALIVLSGVTVGIVADVGIASALIGAGLFSIGTLKLIEPGVDQDSVTNRECRI